MFAMKSVLLQGQWSLEMAAVTIQSEATYTCMPLALDTQRVEWMRFKFISTHIISRSMAIAVYDCLC